MKTTKLIIGIISIVLSVLIALQSCAAGLGNALSSNGEISGTAGILLAITFIVAGIIAVCTRSGGRGGYVSAVFYLLFGFVALASAGSYTDLNIWSGLSIIFGVICAVATRKQR